MDLSCSLCKRRTPWNLQEYEKRLLAKDHEIKVAQANAGKLQKRLNQANAELADTSRMAAPELAPAQGAPMYTGRLPSKAAELQTANAAKHGFCSYRSEQVAIAIAIEPSNWHITSAHADKSQASLVAAQLYAGQ